MAGLARAVSPGATHHLTQRGNRRVDDWKDFLRAPADSGEQDALRLHERTGRPLRDARSPAKLEPLAGRVLRPLKPAPTKKTMG